MLRTRHFFQNCSYVSLNTYVHPKEKVGRWRGKNPNWLNLPQFIEKSFRWLRFLLLGGIGSNLNLGLILAHVSLQVEHLYWLCKDPVYIFIQKHYHCHHLCYLNLSENIERQHVFSIHIHRQATKGKSTFKLKMLFLKNLSFVDSKCTLLMTMDSTPKLLPSLFSSTLKPVSISGLHHLLAEQFYSGHSNLPSVLPTEASF